MVLGYALFHDGKYYKVRDVDGFLKIMREDAGFREALIEQLKSYCYVSDRIDELAEAGKLEVTGEPGKDEKMDEMTINFACLLRRSSVKNGTNSK